MITFKKLDWGNLFAYGDNNSIDLTRYPVTQLVGLNGVGKTSIPLILQETLFAKNIKKIVKAGLVNRWIPKASIWSKLWFEKDNIQYELSMQRKGTKLTVELIEDGLDISKHTAPATYTMLEGILGIDFDTFCQLVYQSSKSSLHFLSATDTQRKKFLVNLFNLEDYLELHELFKSALLKVNREVAVISGKCTVYNDWLKANPESTSDIEDPEELPELNQEDIHQVAVLKDKKSNIEVLNKEINSNNTYKSQLDSLDNSLLSEPSSDISQLQTLRDRKISESTLITQKKKLIKQIDGLSPSCPSCKQSINIEDSVKLAETYREEVVISNEKLKAIIVQLEILEKNQLKNNRIKQTIQQFENLTNLIKPELAEKTIVALDVDAEIAGLAARISSTKREIQAAIANNKKIQERNSELKVRNVQREDYLSKLEVESKALDELSDNVTQLTILKDAFGTNGLLSYKLEFLTKDLEQVINKYLQELSRGRFQLSFTLQGEKLNIDVMDEGRLITINEVSEGELAKINASTLLAIRRLMQDLSNTKLNLLFLDEIMGVLDSFGREDLIEVLLAEESLNTYLVTHEYRHPLVPIITVVQEEKISRIEYDSF